MKQLLPEGRNQCSKPLLIFKKISAVFNTQQNSCSRTYPTKSEAVTVHKPLVKKAKKIWGIARVLESAEMGAKELVSSYPHLVT